MAKKFVRGVTGIEDIESYDNTLTNVNDILSDGQDTYVHTKKGKTESYYKLTDNLKSITSDNSDLITVTKDDTTNTANIHPKHDAQKEQSIESTRSTVTIQKGGNGTSETTKVDTNPQKVLEHDNLLTDYGISKDTSGKTTKLGDEYTRIESSFDLNNLRNGKVRGNTFINSPKDNTWFFVTGYTEFGHAIQEAKDLLSKNTTTYRRTKDNNVWGPWREQVGDKSIIDGLLAQKQNTITNNNSICIYGDSTLRQLYTPGSEYNVTGGYMKILLNYTNPTTNIYQNKTEFKFIVKINKNVNTVTFNLNNDDKQRFTTIFNNYGSDNTVIISGLIFSLTGSSLTVSSPTTLDKNQLITFSDII